MPRPHTESAIQPPAQYHWHATPPAALRECARPLLQQHPRLGVHEGGLAHRYAKGWGVEQMHARHKGAKLGGNAAAGAGRPALRVCVCVCVCGKGGGDS